MLFVGPGVEVYEGMVIGDSMKEEMSVNPTKAKQMSNMRASGSDDAILLTPPLDMTLERALEYIDESEYVEVTPSLIRVRKKLLRETDRRRSASKT